MIRPYAVMLLLLALILIGGGGWLVALGGTLYYLLAGLMLAASGVSLWRRRRLGAWIYALFFVGTVAWAFWESGLDGWALVPRIVAPAVVGLWLLLPPVRRRLEGDVPLARLGSPAGLFVAIGLAALIGGGGHAMRSLPADPIFQNGSATADDGGRFTSLLGGDADWPFYGGDRGGSRYSRLAQIHPGNVDKLEVAWVYRVGLRQSPLALNLMAVPIKVGDAIYACTPYNDVFSVDAETGKERWRFDAEVDLSGLSFSATCRGVAYYRVPNATGECAERILTNTVDARLIALDAHSGKLCRDFGDGGSVSLLTGMGQVTKGYYYVSSPPTIVRGKVVLGGWVSDGQYWGEPSGVIRAFDATTGHFAWAFDMGRPDRQSEPPAGESYTPATPNSWAPMSADEDLGLVFAPTGNATPDYYGAQRRPFDDRYSSSVVAIDADSGQVRWSFQTTHHDLWDYDVPSQPTLVEIATQQGNRRLLVQPTKRGELFVLDRVTGKPYHAVWEHPVPQKYAVPGERPSPTQPFSDGMPSLRGPMLREAMMWGLTPLDQLWCRIEFRRSRYEGPFTLPGLGRPTIVYPGYGGGSNWGGVSVDPDRGVLIANSLRLANRVRLMTREETDGLGVFPLTVESGANGVGGAHPQHKTPYGADVAPFLSPLRVPCQQPPYGMLAGIDLASGKAIWSKRLGTARDSGPFGLRSMLPIPMGVPNFGGSITTRGGLTLIAATQDAYLRAFDTRTGALLWQDRLPAGGQSTPITYLSPRSGRQTVLIMAGGSGSVGSIRGNHLVAYRLRN